MSTVGPLWASTVAPPKEPTGPRCPAVETDSGARCELDERHEGPHTAVARVKWSVALRCRVGAYGRFGEGPCACSRLAGHDGPCIIRDLPPEPSPPVDVKAVRAARKAEALKRKTAPSPRAARTLTYFVQQAPDGPVKIGKSFSPEQRMKGLSSSTPAELVLLATLKGDHERELHQKLVAHRLRGEWFAPHADVLAEVERARQGAAS